MHVELCLPRNTDGYGVNNLLAAVTVWDSQDKQLATAQPQNGSEVVLQVSADIAQPGEAPGGRDSWHSAAVLGISFC
jgi:hypothetical protein